MIFEGESIDIQKILTKLPFKLPGQKYKGEMHFFNSNFIGPGTDLKQRLDENNNPLPHSIPVDRCDLAAMNHDIKYYDENLKNRHIYDKEMLEELKNIKDLTIKERLERFIISKIISLKLKLGLGLLLSEKLNRDVLAQEKHKPYRRPKYHLKVKVFNKDDLFSADLVFMPKDSSYLYILTVIDVYTRYVWCKPLFLKSDTLKAFKEILSESKRIPKKLWVDKGTEFYNKNFKAYLKEHSIEMYSTENAGKAVVIERFNRTIEEWLWRKFTEQGNQKWVKILPELVDIYNHKIHRSIKVSPIEASNNPQKIKDITNTNNFYNENNYT